ncbi:MAG: hypothetical protein HY744_28490 [Deltaproteobacteria bacterium]|nr:hypothetical protein [Deltaproteobacteria bacterium]
MTSSRDCKAGRGLGLLALFPAALAAFAACSGGDSDTATTPASSSGGAQGCPAGLTDCAGTCVQPSYDPDNCGACGIGCPQDQFCSEGKCVGAGAGGSGLGCPPGLTDCAGTCVQPGHDPANCGACGNACPEGERCSEGKCVGAGAGGSGQGCPPGLTDCGGTCVVTALDPANCGGCGKACPASQVCSTGTCNVACLGGTTKCSDACVDADVDPQNCGGCDVVCKVGEVCSKGQCALECAGGSTKCSDKCVSTENDPLNCGACGKACGLNEVCSAEKCGLLCFGGTTQCGQLCVDAQHDPANCGSCGKACAQGEICDAGQCAFKCSGGSTLCGNKCVDVQIDSKNCGKCGAACGAGQVCSAGACVLQCFGGPCGSGETLWSLRAGDAYDNWGWGVAIDGKGEVVATGGFAGTLNFGGGPLTSPGYPAQDIWLAKLDGKGKHVWSQRFGDAAYQYGRAVAVDSKNNIYFVGEVQGTVNFGGSNLKAIGGWDISLAKLDANGTHLWSKIFGNAADQIAYFVEVDASDNVLLSCQFQGNVDFGGGALTSAGGYDACLAKFDSTGKHLWSKKYGDASAQEARDLAIDASGNVFLTGWFQGTVDFGCGALTSAGKEDVFVAKLDKDGKCLWSKKFGDNNGSRGWGLATDSAGNVIVQGHFQTAINFGGGPLNSAGGYDIFIAKLSGKDGSHIWGKRYGNSNVDQYGLRVTVDPQDNVIATGYFQGSLDFGGGALNTAGSYDGYLVKLDKDGVHKWSKRFGDASDNRTICVASDGAGRIALTGYFQGSIDLGGGLLDSQGSNDIFIATFAP